MSEPTRHPIWAKVTFNDVTHTRSGNSKLIKGKLHSEPSQGLFPAYSASGQNVWHSEFEHEGTAIIVSAVGARCGKCFLATGRWSAIANTHVVWPDTRFVDPEYLLRLIDDEGFWIKGGSAQPFVKVSETFKGDLCLPPLNEQRRIVAKLDRLSARSAAARDHLARVEKLAARAKQAILAAAFSSDATRDWVGCKVQDAVTESLVGLVRSKQQQSDRGIPYIRMNHYDLMGCWNEADLTCVDCSDAEFRRYELKEGDLLFNTRNSSELVGKVGLWPADKPGHVYNNNLLRLRFNETVEPAFTFHWMTSPSFRAYLEGVKSATTSVAAIYQKSLLRAPVRFPPREEQRGIVSRIEAAFARIDRLTAEAGSAAHLLDCLDERLLAKAFRGELVSRDPNDEPAEALLARIREARAATPKARRGGRRKAS